MAEISYLTLGKLGSGSAAVACADATPFISGLSVLCWALIAARLLFETPAPVAASRAFLSLMLPIVLDVSDLESSAGRGRAGGISFKLSAL
jgi:hypothetical protein